MLTALEAPTPKVESLLTRAMFPNPGRVRRVLEEDRTAAGRRVFAWVVDGRALSAAGVRQRDGEVEVLHLGTRPGEERRGHARALLHALLDHLNAARLVAETDDTAVEFYRRSGFEITPAPPRGGQRRHLCTLTRP